MAMNRELRGLRERAQRFRSETSSAEEAVAADESAAAQFDRMEAAARTERDGLAGLEASGSISSEKADARALELMEAERIANASASRKRAVAEERRGILRTLEAELEQVLFAVEVAELQRRIAVRETREKEFLKQLEPVVESALTLRSAQAEERDQWNVAQAARVGDAVIVVDEVDAGDFPETDDLIALLGEGPTQPGRAAQLSAKQSAAALANTRAATWSSAIRLHASRARVDEAELRRLGYDAELIQAVHAEHDRLVRVHAEYEAANAGKFVRV